MTAELLNIISVFGFGAMLGALGVFLFERLSREGRDLEGERKEEELLRYGAEHTLASVRRVSILGGVGLATGFFLLTQNFVFAFIIFIIGMVIPFIYPWWVKRSYIDQFEAGFSECLDIWSRCLQAGLSFQQALEAAAKDMHGPAAMEMERIRKEVSLGDVDAALWNFYNRMPLPDVRYAVIGVITCRQTGGRISEVVSKIADSIRERASQRQKIMAITSMGRTEAYIMAAMPFLIGLFMYMLQPDTVMMLFNTTFGVIGTLIAIAWESVGMLIIWKIVDIKE